MYTEPELDQGVALAGGGYRAQWGEFGNPYWKTPTPPDVYYEYYYILNPDSVETLIKVPIDQLPLYVRSGEYLEQALTVLEEAYGDAVITTIPILEENDIVPNNWYVVCIAGITAVAPTLDQAKWEAIGVWGLQNIFPSLDAGYLKTGNDNIGVFMLDEKTYLVL